MKETWIPKPGETVQFGSTIAVVKEVHANSRRDGSSQFFVDVEEYPHRLRKGPVGKKVRGKSAEEIVARKLMGISDKPRNWRIPLSKITRTEECDGTTRER